MAKKDTYLALLRRGIDDTTAQQLADAGLKIGDLKKIDKDMLVENYALKPDIADGVISIISAGHTSHGKERFLAKVLAPERKVESKIEEMKFQRKQKDVLTELAEEKERLKIVKVEAFRAKKLVMNRLGKTVELIVKLENNLYDEGKDDQKVKIRDQLETRGLEAARDHEMLDLEGTPQDIVDFRRKYVPKLVFHACPICGDEMDPRQARDQDKSNEWVFICWECEENFIPELAVMVEEKLLNGSRIHIDENKPPRNPVPPKPASMDLTSVNDMIRKDLEQTGATADEMSKVVEESTLGGGLMDINDWIDQTLAAKDYIQAQEDREDFILRTGAGATKFNKWMKKAGLFFNKQTGRWTRHKDMR
ncbi:MAG: hypothetical protein CBE08_003455 [Euryarchaeota archaeon TMED248]|nr:MAG: hypothetical protein CBE08_003455 [Euryarchaeota archaeon TMED248]|tara:strand:+ start:4317 stop:5408 length:1092 start_codon:yes stop_codon:yes gene_type:complete